jgi:hypothetical protein
VVPSPLARSHSSRIRSNRSEFARSSASCMSSLAIS